MPCVPGRRAERAGVAHVVWFRAPLARCPEARRPVGGSPGAAELVDEIRSFFVERARIEADYAKSVRKLAESFLKKKAWPAEPKVVGFEGADHRCVRASGLAVPPSLSIWLRFAHSVAAGQWHSLFPSLLLSLLSLLVSFCRCCCCSLSVAACVSLLPCVPPS